MQKVRVFDPFDPSLKQPVEALEMWALEAFELLKESSSDQGKIIRENCAGFTPEQILMWLTLSSMYSILGRHGEECAMKHAAEVVKEGYGFTPFVAQVQEAMTLNDPDLGDYIIQPDADVETYIERSRQAAPPEVRADWDSTYVKRKLNVLRKHFEHRRGHIVEGFQLMEEQGTTFEKSLDWREIEVKDIPDGSIEDDLSDLLGGLLGGLFGRRPPF